MVQEYSGMRKTSSEEHQHLGMTNVISRQANKTPLIARLADGDGADIGAQLEGGIRGKANIAADFAAGEVALDGEREIAGDGADIGFGVKAEGGTGRQGDGEGDSVR